MFYCRFLGFSVVVWVLGIGWIWGWLEYGYVDIICNCVVLEVELVLIVIDFIVNEWCDVLFDVCWEVGGWGIGIIMVCCGWFVVDVM